MSINSQQEKLTTVSADTKTGYDLSCFERGLAVGACEMRTVFSG